MPSLNRALPLPKMSNVARAIPENLDLDMPRGGHEALDINLAVAKGRARFRLAPFERFLQLGGAANDAHPAAATAGDRLDYDRAVRRRKKALGLRKARRACGPGQNRNSALLRELPRAYLVAEQFQHVGLRADKPYASFGATPRESRVLAEKSVAGMDSVALCLRRERQNLFAVEIRRRADAAQLMRLVRADHVERPRVILGKYRDRAQFQLARGLHHTNRDFATIGDQQSFETHQFRLLRL